MTRHSELVPHEPGQGSRHLLLMHACVEGQSGLMMHSTRQLGGAPKKSGWHWHTGPLSSARQMELGPHGEGTQGSVDGGASFSFSIAGISKQLLNGSPVVPGGQPQMGLWLITSQRASMPQAPAQGSTHLRLTHACRAEHSLETTHSGRHCGGAPMKPSRHEHTACPLTSRH